MSEQEIALQLLAEFKTQQPTLKIKAVLADALYGTQAFMDQAARLFNQTQVISQLRSNQLVRHKNQKIKLDQYFAKQPACTQTIPLRGQEKKVTWAAAHLYVYAHHQKRLVIALKYDDETDYRYLVASDLSWRVVDVLEVYGLRWLVEVFFQDWKAYEGWGQLTKQPDEAGSSRSLILSWLLDHALFFHPDQLARLENKLPAATVGSLQEKIKAENLLCFIHGLLTGGNLDEKLEGLSEAVSKTFRLSSSKKHMVQQEVVCFKPDFGSFAHCLTLIRPPLIQQKT
ncbi:MAG: transposase [Chloroflexota bacterium]